MKHLLIPAAAAVAISAASVFAQQANRPYAERQQEDPATTTPRPLADRPSASILVQKNGGSLFKATSLTNGPTIDGAPPKVRSISVFAVPEPEPKTIKKHDQVTIIIREESETSTDSSSELKKEADFDARIEEFIRLGSLLKDGKLVGGGVSDPIPSVKLSGERNFKGEGKIERSDSFVARIQAEVVDVKPNGTFAVQARKFIKNDEEEQEFILTGTCRAADVTADNTVLSTQIYNLELIKNTKGAARDATKRGFVPKLLDAINPF